MFFRDAKIGVRLGIGFSLIIMLVVGLSAITINYMKTLSDLTTKLYEHPFAVSQAILRIDGNIIRMHRSMKDVALALEEKDIEVAVEKVNALEEKVFDDFRIVHERFLGSKEKVASARNSFSAWKPIRDEVISLMYGGKHNEAANITKGKGAFYIEQLSRDIDEFIKFAQRKADSFLKEAEQSRDQALYLTYTSLIVTTIIVLLFAFFFTRSITFPLSVAVQTSNELAKGNLTTEIPIKGKDEVSQLLVSMKNLADKLQQATIENKNKDWIKTGQNKLNEKMSGGQNLKSLSNNIITFLVQYLGSQVGAIYTFNDKVGDLFLSGMYALSAQTNLKKRIKLGEGLVGQAAIQKEMISVSNLQDELRIQSSIVDVTPNHIIIIPFLYEGELKGVIEIGSVKKFSETQIELLNGIMKNIAISFNTAQVQIETGVLLEETQQLADSLQVQQETLKNANVELEKKTEELATTSLYKSQFLANMSHEIRTPLNSIVGFSQILLKQTENMNISHEFIEYIKNIEISGENLSELINNILDLSKIEAGKFDVSFEDLNIRLLIQGIYHINKAQAIKNEINFNYEISSSIPDIINSDRSKLNQILMNLVSNAIKFTPKGKSVWLKVLRDNDFILFHVKDEGYGISKEQQKMIFEPFEQADSSITKEYSGTGLGLSIVKAMVNLLMGSIELESDKGNGSIFIVRIPLAKGKTVAVEVEQNWGNVCFFNDNKILVVEDNEMNQEMIHAMFKELELKVYTANNGKAGVEKALKLKPDLILMDIHMPGMGGIEATRKIHQHPEGKDIPIVALTADAFKQQQNFISETGISDYLTKPLNVNRLLPVLKKYLRYDETTGDSNSLDKLPPLPAAFKDKLIEEFKIMAEIPFFMTGKINEQIKKIKQLYTGNKMPLPGKLSEIQKAISIRDTEKIKTIIHEVING
ncbi:MAG: ATP-binding protein [Melioribacteraceae bacterium]|nr:ATP-binding protein [Melioribacteraceae bacterium]